MSGLGLCYERLRPYHGAELVYHGAELVYPPTPHVPDQKKTSKCGGRGAAGHAGGFILKPGRAGLTLMLFLMGVGWGHGGWGVHQLSPMVYQLSPMVYQLIPKA